jgi:hypothetical protein
VAATISDEVMQARLETVRPYVAAFLKKGPAYTPPDARSPSDAAIVKEHGRRNMLLQSEGKLAIVGPLTGAGDIVGFYVFAAPETEVRAILESDVAVQASIFSFEIVTLYGFPGDRLPPA